MMICCCRIMLLGMVPIRIYEKGHLNWPREPILISRKPNQAWLGDLTQKIIKAREV